MCVRVVGIDVYVYAHMLLTCLVCVSVLIMLGHSLLILCVCVRVVGIDVYVYAHTLLTFLVCVSVLIMLGQLLPYSVCVPCVGSQLRVFQDACWPFVLLSLC